MTEMVTSLRGKQKRKDVSFLCGGSAADCLKVVNKSYWTLDVPDGVARGLKSAKFRPDLTV